MGISCAEWCTFKFVVPFSLLTIGVFPFALLANLPQLTEVGRKKNNPDVRRIGTGQILDPTDMFTFGEASKEPLKSTVNNLQVEELQRSLAQCRLSLVEIGKDKEASSKCNVLNATFCKGQMAMVKYLFRRLMLRIPSKDISSDALFVGELFVSNREISAWNQLLSIDAEDSESVINALLQLDNALHSVQFVKANQRHWNHSFPGHSVLSVALPWLNLAIVVAVSTHLVQQICRQSSIGIFVWFFLCCFIVSFAWTWHHMYKSKVAETMAKLKSTPVNSCQSVGQMTPWQTAALWAKSIFGTLQPDPCLELQKALTVDPFWQVKPLQVFMVTIVEFFLEPLDLITSKFSLSYVRLLSNVPLWHQPFVILAFGASVVLVFLFVFRYRLRLFYGALTVEPSGQNSQSAQSTNLVVEEAQRRTSTGLSEHASSSSNSDKGKVVTSPKTTG